MVFLPVICQCVALMIILPVEVSLCTDLSPNWPLNGFMVRRRGCSTKLHSLASKF